MKYALHSVVISILALAMLGCGGGNNNSSVTPPTQPPPAAVSISLSATSATVQTTQYNDPGSNQFQFTATVQNASDTSVTWDINGQHADFDTTYGKISSTGMYTAPFLIPNDPIQVRATANADKTKSATATVTLQWSAQMYNLQASPATVETSSSVSITAFYDTNGPRDLLWTVNGKEMGSAVDGAFLLDYRRESGYYIAPATVPAAPVRLSATLKSNGKSANTYVTVVGNSDPSALNVAVSPATATLEPGAQQSFSATVTSNGNPVQGGVTWSAGTYGGSYTHVLTDGVMKADGSYTAPFDPPDNRVIVVRASASGSTPKTGYAVVSLVPPAVDPNSRVNGQYGFALHDSVYQTTVFGTIIADGHGNWSGTADVIAFNGRLSGQPITGTYAVHPDGRVDGTITLTVSVQTFTQPISLMLVSDNRAYAFSCGSMGTFVGTVERQDATAFDATALQGDYGFLLHGRTYANQGQISSPYTWGGVLTLNADGTVSGMGTWDDGAARDETLTGTYTFDRTTGRGVLTLPTSGPTYHVGFAAISTDTLLLATSDDVSAATSAAILVGSAERRTVVPPLTLTNVTGPFAFYLQGQQWIEAGHFSADGAGGISSGLLDMRDTSPMGPANYMEWATFDGTYTIDANDPYGRGWLDLTIHQLYGNPDIHQNGRFYAIAPKKLIILLDSNAAAAAGEVLDQTPPPDIPQDGRYAVHFVGDDWNHDATGWTMPVTMAAGAPWIGWLNYPGHAKQEWELDQSGAEVPGVYTLSVSLFTGEAFPNLRLYTISPSKFLLIGLDMGYAAPNEFVWMEKIQ